MADEDQLVKQVSDGVRALQLVREDPFNISVKMLITNYVETMTSAQPQAVREAAYQKHRVLEELILELQKVIDTGSVAKVELNKKRR